MTDALASKLQRIQGRETLYELTAEGPDGSRLLVAYCSPRSRSSLLRALRARALDVVRVTGAEEFTPAKRAADGVTVGAFTVRFSGRTQRDAYLAGEHPFIADAPAPTA